MEINIEDKDEEDVLFESIGDPSPRMITPYLMMDQVYNMYDQYDIITKLAFHPYTKYIYVILYDSPMDLMLTTLSRMIPELQRCMLDQPDTSLLFHCHHGPNRNVTISLSYLCPLKGNYYELMIRTIEKEQDLRWVRSFMEERRRKMYV